MPKQEDTYIRLSAVVIDYVFNSAKHYLQALLKEGY